MSYIGNPITTTAFLTDQFNGDNSTTAFTLSTSPANPASILVSVSGVLQDPTTYSISGRTLNFSGAPPVGTGNISIRYLGIPASGVTTTAYRTITEYTATAGQTTFTPPSYTVGFIAVYRNGVRLGAADFTATNGTSVVLASAATLGDLVVTESYYVSSVLNAIPAVAGAVNSAYLAANLSMVTPSVTTTLGVGGATPATSGAGITFPATQSSSTDANTLDDYEEGTWTPTFRGAGTAGTYTTANVTARYVKVGGLVTAWAYVEFSAASGGSNYMQIQGLPFNYLASSTCSPGTIWATYLNFANTPISLAVLPYTSSASNGLEIVITQNNASYADTSIAALSTSSRLGFTFTYQT